MRILLGVTLAGALAANALAQDQPVTGQRAPNAVAQTFLHFGQPYGGWILMALDSIPANRYGFKPTPVQRSVGNIAQHLESANYGLCALIGGAPHAMSAKDSLADSVKARWPKDTLIARVRASLMSCAATISKLTDVQLADEMTAPSPDGPVTVVRARYLMLLITDLAEHYSQLAGYMRELGLTPPSALPAKQ
jgi:uncharacterized damage-inducible protein DinB